MKRKIICFSETAYVLGMVQLAFGTALMEKADFGMSMIVAPAYLIHLKVSQYIPGFSFGMAEYLFQAFLILCLSLYMKRFRAGYIFSFVTAVLYGILLDLFVMAVSGAAAAGIYSRIVFFACGILLCTAGVAFLFHTYIAPEAYELAVMEISRKNRADLGKIKTIYDVSSCVLSVVLSFLFFGFGHFEGIKAGTFVCALLNGWLISRFSSLYESRLEFKDALPLRPQRSRENTEGR